MPNRLHTDASAAETATSLGLYPPCKGITVSHHHSGEVSSDAANNGASNNGAVNNGASNSGGIHSCAFFDQSGRYRYSLRRQWGPGDNRLVLILLNPSTADASRDDPTLRRCQGFAREWGFSSMEIVNLFAYKATQPANLKKARNPVGAENDRFVEWAVRNARKTVLAWGNHGDFKGRDQQVLRLLGSLGNPLWSLGLTKKNQPRHLLYLPKGTPLQAFSLAVGAHVG